MNPASNWRRLATIAVAFVAAALSGCAILGAPVAVLGEAMENRWDPNRPTPPDRSNFERAPDVSVEVTQDGRNLDGKIDDRLIESRISRAIAAKIPTGNAAHVSVTSMNGVVLLTGDAPMNTMRDEILEIARNTAKVRQVVNEIRIDYPSDPDTRKNDSLFTSEIERRLLNDADIRNPTRIKVHTANSVVYLMGLVHRADAHAATEVVCNIAGVALVKRVFEYVD